MVASRLRIGESETQQRRRLFCCQAAGGGDTVRESTPVIPVDSRCPMKSAALRCPSCETPLRLAVSPAPGQKIRCPKCKGVFAVPKPEPEVVAAAELVEEEEEDEAITDRPRKGRTGHKAVLRKRDRDEDEDDEEDDEEDEEDEDEDEEERPRRRKKKGVPRVVWIALAGALLVGGAALYLFVFKSGDSVKLGVAKD